MKKQIRPDEPDVLKENAQRWNQQWVELKAKNSSASFVWYAVDNRSARDWILPVLRRMNQEHCSFCDCYPLFSNTNEPIEHFRPKSDARFRHLAFTWANLYYACPKCQSCKRERWDDGLIAPDENDFEFEKYFVFDFTNGAISPNPRASADTQSRAKCTIELYGLDIDERRRQRLVEARKWSKSQEQDLNDWPYRDFIAVMNT